MLDARLVYLNARGLERGLALLPCGVRADVDVVGGASAQGVAHPAAHDPRLVPGGLKDRKRAKRMGRGEVTRYEGSWHGYPFHV